MSVLFPVGMGLRWGAGALPAFYVAASLVISAIVILSHRPNIRRLSQGTERRIGERVSLKREVESSL